MIMVLDSSMMRNNGDGIGNACCNHVDHHHQDNVTAQYNHSTVNLFPLGFNPGNEDIIIGKGKRYCKHPGNLKLRRRVQSKLSMYLHAKTKAAKSAIISDIIQGIRCNDDGEFLQLDKGTGLWKSAHDYLAREKTSQAFRDALRQYYKSSRENKRKPLLSSSPGCVGCSTMNASYSLTSVEGEQPGEEANQEEQQGQTNNSEEHLGIANLLWLQKQQYNRLRTEMMTQKQEGKRKQAPEEQEQETCRAKAAAAQHQEEPQNNERQHTMMRMSTATLFKSTHVNAMVPINISNSMINPLIMHSRRDDTGSNDDFYTKICAYLKRSEECHQNIMTEDHDEDPFEPTPLK